MKTLIDVILMMMVLLLLLIPLGSVARVAWMKSTRGLAWNAADAGTVFGMKVYFAENGETVESVTVSAGTAPAGSVLTTWRELGCLKSVTPQQARAGGVKIRCYDTTLGKYVTEDTVNEQLDVMLNLVLQEVDDLIIALSFGANSAGNGTYTPASGEGKARGYLLYRLYDGTNLVHTVKVWGDLSVTSGPNAQEAPGDVACTFQILNNTNNTALAAGVLAPA